MAGEQAGRGETMMRVSWGVGLAVGMGSGIALGSAMQNMGVGIAIGLALGVVIMGAFSVSVAGARMRRDAATEEPVPEEHIDGSNRPGDGATPGRASDGGAQPRSGPEA